jgi:hypothetical protein
LELSSGLTGPGGLPLKSLKRSLGFTESPTISTPQFSLGLALLGEPSPLFFKLLPVAGALTLQSLSELV